MAANPKLLGAEDFYRTLVQIEKNPDRYLQLKSILTRKNWTITLDEFGSPKIQISGQPIHVEDAYRQFSLDPIFFEPFFDELMKAW